MNGTTYLSTKINELAEAEYFHPIIIFNFKQHKFNHDLGACIPILSLAHTFSSINFSKYMFI